MLLYINANSNTDEFSTTSKIANAFVKEYAKGKEIETYRINLIDYLLPELDRDVYSENDKEITETKLKRRNKALQDFMEADVVVVAAPMWNFLYPAVLKTWIDAIVASKKTFKYTSKGPIGLAGDKKIVFIQSSGGNYDDRPEMNHGLAHFKTIMKFMGIKDIYTVIAGGTAKNREALLIEKTAEAIELARTL